MATRMTNALLEKLLADRERLRANIGALQGELSGIERAISYARNQEPQTGTNEEHVKSGQQHRPRLAVKEIILGLLSNHAMTGLGTGEILSYAKASGHDLDPNSVSSLLSRMKSDGVLIYEEKKYKPVSTRPILPFRAA